MAENVGRAVQGKDQKLRDFEIIDNRLKGNNQDFENIINRLNELRIRFKGNGPMLEENKHELKLTDKSDLSGLVETLSCELDRLDNKAGIIRSLLTELEGL